MPDGRNRPPIKYADLFEKEAGQHVNAIRSILAGLEAAGGDPDPVALVRSLRHESHGLAGVASAVGLDDVTSLMHAVEEASVAVAKGDAAVAPPGLIQAVRRALDAADDIGRHALEGRYPSPPVDVDGLIAAVRTGAGLL